MFTVKHISSGRREAVYLADEVQYDPKHGQAHGGIPAVIAWGVKSGGADSTLTFEFGHIYVMNPNGKTVASYELGVEPEAVAA